MRLINANRAISKVDEIPTLADKNQAFFEGCRYMKKRCLKIIRTSKTIDAVPVVHGRWVQHRNGADAQCTNCNWSTDFDIPLNYCPNCGARMDGE